MKNNILVICSIICSLLCIFPFGVINFAFSANYFCNNINIMGIQITSYISCLNAICFIICIFLFLSNILVLYEEATDSEVTTIKVFSVLNIIFGIGWFIAGFRLLNISNNDCIRNGIIYIVTGLLIECGSMFNLFKNYCGSREECASMIIFFKKCCGTRGEIV